MTSLQKLLAEVKARLDAATPGPWSIAPRNVCFYYGDKLMPLTNELCLDEDNQNGNFLGAKVVGPVEPGRSDFVVRDAGFIANCPTDLSKLIQIVEALSEGLAQIDNEWCLHPGMPIAEDSRQWCTACSEWIYPNEVNPAREALKRAEDIANA